jgi:hypothetical protein
VTECRNCMIVEHIHALLHASGLPRMLWGEAAHHVVWLMNRTLTKAVAGKTPYKAAFGIKPDLSQLREWGKKVWVRIEGGDKLGGRVREGRWLGIDERSNCCRVYWPDKQTVTTEHNVYFDKTQASAECLEGEDWDFVEPSPDSLTSVPSTSNNASHVSTSTTPPPTPAQQQTPPEQEVPARRI